MPNDFVTDENPDVFIHLHDSGAMPDYVYNADVITPGECSALADVAFADPNTRSFPCHTKAACWESAAYFAGRGMEDDNVKENIEKMASIHGIEDDVKAVFDHFESEYAKEASSEEEPEEKKYALSIDFEGEGGRDVVNYFPINNQIECVMSSEKAAAAFRANTLPLPMLFKAANMIVAAAEDPNELDPAIASLGTPRFPDPNAFEYMLNMRKYAGVRDLSPYEEIARVIDSTLEKAASVEEAIELAASAANEVYLNDLNNGIHYKNGMEDPFSMVFTGPRLSELDEFNASTVKVAGVRVPVTDFLNLRDDDIERIFSKGIQGTIKAAKERVSGERSIEKAAAASEKVATLSSDAQNILLATLAGIGW